MNVVLVACGAAVRAPLRFLTDRALKTLTPGTFPWGTFAVNIVGSLILGVPAAATPAVAVLVGIGVLRRADHLQHLQLRDLRPDRGP
jgi:fluoride exporter